MSTLRLTIEERRYEQVRGDLLQAENERREAKALPGAYRTAVKRYRKALYRAHLTAHHPALTKEWQEYAGQRGRKTGGGYGIVKFHKPEAEAARKADDALVRVRDGMTEIFDQLKRRKELLSTARTKAATLAPHVEVFRRLAEDSRARLDKKKVETDKKRAAKAPVATWVELEQGKAVMGKPLAAWKRTFTARMKTPLTMSRENGSFVFQHPTGELRLNWKRTEALTGKERTSPQPLAA